METPKHTPGPWKAVRDNSHLRLQQWDVYADNGRGKLLAEVLGDNAEANADFIVRACNAHDDLLAALRGLTNALFETGLATLPGDAAFDVRRECDNALAAIAKATE